MTPLPVNQSYGAWKGADDKNKEQPWDDKNRQIKGKGGKKGKAMGSSMAPRGMVGCVGRDHKGRSICVNYNLSECKGAADGAACAKGRHVCFTANCFKPHAFSKAHASEMPQKECLGNEVPNPLPDLHLKDLVIRSSLNSVRVQLVLLQLRKAGLLGCKAVDKHRDRNALASIIQLDLACDKDQALVMGRIEHPCVIGIF